MIGLIGKKCGMTRVFREDGTSIPVTVIDVQPNRVTQVKTIETDGYRALQVAAGAKKASRTTKAQAGHFAKANVEASRVLQEFRVTGDEADDINVGSEIKADIFEAGQAVDVRATSKGKGFQGGVKRHNFHMQDATHGNSVSHRALGSTGQCQTPGRVLRGKKMPGQMGNKQITVQNQEVVRVDSERGLILIKGTVPGAPGGSVIVLPSIKKKKIGAQ